MDNCAGYCRIGCDGGVEIGWSIGDGDGHIVRAWSDDGVRKDRGNDNNRLSANSGGYLMLDSDLCETDILLRQLPRQKVRFRR